MLIPYDGQRAYRAFWCEVGIGWFFLELRSQLTAKESFPLSATESQTRTRGWVTTTISCVRPATQHGNTTRPRTQSRGTPVDARRSRGTGLRIIHIVTSTGGRGSIFPTTKKRGSGLSPPQKFSKGGLHATLSLITQHEADIPVLAHFRSQAPKPPRCSRMGTCQVVIPLAHCVYHPAPLQEQLVLGTRTRGWHFTYA